VRLNQLQLHTLNRKRDRVYSNIMELRETTSMAGIPSIVSSVEGLPASFLSNRLSDARGIDRKVLIAKPVGTDVFLPGQEIQFRIPSGAEKGFVRRGASYITATLEIVSSGTMFSVTPSTLDTNYVHALGFKGPTYSSLNLKQGQTFNIGQAQVYNMPYYGEYSGLRKMNTTTRTYTSEMRQIQNQHDFLHPNGDHGLLTFNVRQATADGPIAQQNYNFGGTRIPINIPTDCPILDAQQDFPAFMVPSFSLNIQLTTENDIFQVTPMTNSKYPDRISADETSYYTLLAGYSWKLTNVELHYEVLLPGVQFEQQFLASQQATGTGHLIKFNQIGASARTLQTPSSVGDDVTIDLSVPSRSINNIILTRVTTSRTAGTKHELEDANANFRFMNIKELQVLIDNLNVMEMPLRMRDISFSAGTGKLAGFALHSAADDFAISTRKAWSSLYTRNAEKMHYTNTIYDMNGYLPGATPEDLRMWCVGVSTERVDARDLTNKGVSSSNNVQIKLRYATDVGSSTDLGSLGYNIRIFINRTRSLMLYPAGNFTTTE
jgi:hypothetical protein